MDYFQEANLKCLSHLRLPDLHPLAFKVTAPGVCCTCLAQSGQAELVLPASEITGGSSKCTRQAGQMHFIARALAQPCRDCLGTAAAPLARSAHQAPALSLPTCTQKDLVL